MAVATHFQLNTMLFNLLVLFLSTLGDGLASDSESPKSVMERSLSTPTISASLRQKFSKSKDFNSERISIMIEFPGGNSKPIRDYKMASVASKASLVLKGERISTLVGKLEDHADEFQKELIDFLSSQNAEYHSLWAANELCVTDASFELISEIASRFGTKVKTIRALGKVKPPTPIFPSKPKPSLDISSGPGTSSDSDVPQNILQVGARCKDIKCLGEGAVVMILDTGVLWTHIELRDNYRQEFGWFDPSDGTEFPINVGDHGTHVAGIAVGKTKGIAPKAKWIACKWQTSDVDKQDLTELYSKTCMQWALCPTRWNDTNDRDCSMAPDVINNSWGTTYEDYPEGSYYDYQEAWFAAGIISIFSAGNDGPFCTTLHIPGGYDSTFAIAAIDHTSTITYFSSRGPVKLGGLGDWEGHPGYGVRTCSKNCPGAGGADLCVITKPDLAAPGNYINSSYSDADDAYIVFSGTSMAAPLVTGVVALMVCANNKILGNPRLDQATAIQILKETARTDRINLEQGNAGAEIPWNMAKTSNLLCNVAYGNTCGTYPNNMYGWGEVDACSAVKKVNKAQPRTAQFVSEFWQRHE